MDVLHNYVPSQITTDEVQRQDLLRLGYEHPYFKMIRNHICDTIIKLLKHDQRWENALGDIKNKCNDNILEHPVLHRCRFTL